MIKPGAYPLSEGKYIIGFDKIFKPVLSHETPTLKPGDLLVEIQPFLIVTSTDFILLDAGLGFMGDNGQPNIINNLEWLGVHAHQISQVLLSHLHHDHVGGLINPATQQANFIYATHYIQQEEWQYAFANDGLSYPTQTLLQLQNQLPIAWLSGNGNINNIINYEISGGHTPYHQVFSIQTERDSYFFGGDVLPQVAQLHYNFKAKYDYDGAQSLKMRQAYALRGKAAHWNYLFYHDIASPTFSFK